MPFQRIAALKLGQPCDSSDEPSPKRRAIPSADSGTFRSLLEGYHHQNLSSGNGSPSDIWKDEDAPETSTPSESSNVEAITPNGSFGDGMSSNGFAIPSPQICYGMVSTP